MKSLQAILLVTPILLMPFEDKEPPPVRVSGVVVDAGTLAPLSGAEVRWDKKSIRSDAGGRYQIDVPPGAREVRIAAERYPAVTKLVIADTADAAVRLDVLLPKIPGQKVLALDRRSALSITDAYGNADEAPALGIGGARAWSPIWLDASTIAYGQDRTIHRTENLKLLGVYRFHLDSRRTEQALSGVPASFLSKSPQSGALAVANQKEIYLGDRRIYDLPANAGRLLSIEWATDGRIYFTVEDRIPLDSRHSIGRSRIASIQPDGSALRPNWRSAELLSFRYPLSEGGDLLFARFALNGSRQSIWRGSTELAAGALRPVHFDRPTQRLYYTDGHALHLRDLPSGRDFVIVTSVESADFR
jgi:hypothetical protein